VNAKEKALAEAERERLAIEFEAMCWEDEEAEQMRKWYTSQEEEAQVQQRALLHRADTLRSIEEEAQKIQALAAEEDARRAAGDVQVCVYVNKSLKIKVEFWMKPGSPGKAVHDMFAGEVTRKFANMRFDAAAAVLLYCDDQATLGDSLREGDEESRVELEISRSLGSDGE